MEALFAGCVFFFLFVRPLRPLCLSLVSAGFRVTFCAFPFEADSWRPAFPIAHVCAPPRPLDNHDLLPSSKVDLFSPSFCWFFVAVSSAVIWTNLLLGLRQTFSSFVVLVRFRFLGFFPFRSNFFAGLAFPPFSDLIPFAFLTPLLLCLTSFCTPAFHFVSFFFFFVPSSPGFSGEPECV